MALSTGALIGIVLVVAAVVFIFLVVCAWFLFVNYRFQWRNDIEFGGRHLPSALSKVESGFNGNPSQQGPLFVRDWEESLTKVTDNPIFEHEVPTPIGLPRASREKKERPRRHLEGQKRGPSFRGGNGRPNPVLQEIPRPMVNRNGRSIRKQRQRSNSAPQFRGHNIPEPVVDRRRHPSDHTRDHISPRTFHR